MTVFAAAPFKPTTNTTTTKKKNKSNTTTTTTKRLHNTAAVSKRLYPGKRTDDAPPPGTTSIPINESTDFEALFRKTGTRALPSTPVKLNRSLLLEHDLPHLSKSLKHPIDHCYDVQTKLQTPHKHKHYTSQWKTYCPHHDHLLGTTTNETIISRRKGSYIYELDRSKNALVVREIWPVPSDLIVGAVSGKYHTFWFLRDDLSSAYVTSRSQASLGQMGLGSTIHTASFKVPQMIRFKSHKKSQTSLLPDQRERIKIACGEVHTLFSVQGGKRLYACGSNLRGACGLGASRCIQEARRVKLPSGYAVQHIAAGDAHSVIVARNEAMFSMYDEIFVMGSMKSGAIGSVNTYDESDSMTAASSSESSTVAGHAAAGRHFGTSTTAWNHSMPEEDVPSNASKFWIRHPTRFSHSLLRKKTFQGVYCGAQFTLLHAKSGEVYGMGLNESGCLGVGHRQPVHEPLVVFRSSSYNEEDITHIACGAAHCIIVTNYRNVYVCGANNLFQLGLDHNIDIDTFTRVKHEILSHKVIRMVKCGRHCSVIVTGDNCVFAFGGRFGELHESRFLELNSDGEEIYDVTIENDVPMIILGKKGVNNRRRWLL